MQWWSFIRKFQMMSWHPFFSRKICKFSDLFLKVGPEWISRNVGGFILVLLRWTFLAQFLFFSSLQTKAKECQCDIRRNFYFFGGFHVRFIKVEYFVFRPANWLARPVDSLVDLDPDDEEEPLSSFFFFRGFFSSARFHFPRFRLPWFRLPRFRFPRFFNNKLFWKIIIFKYLYLRFSSTTYTSTTYLKNDLTRSLYAPHHYKSL